MARLTGTAPKRVGLIVGREWSFPPAFIEEVAKRDEGVTVEYVKIGATADGRALPLRRDHRPHLPRGAVLPDLPQAGGAGRRHRGQQPVHVDAPTTSSSARRWRRSSAWRIPKTVALPNKEYVPGIVPSESLRNLEFPLDWEGIVEYVGLPCILKDAHGGGWKEVYVCRSLDELIHHYDHSGPPHDGGPGVHRVGAVRPLPLPRPGGDPADAVRSAGAEVPRGARAISRPSSRPASSEDARTLVRALGYDMNSIEFAIRDGIPYAIDFMNPAPDMDINSLTPTYFEWAVQAHGRHGHPAGEEAASPVARAQVGRRVHRRALGAIPCRRRSPTTTSC